MINKEKLKFYQIIKEIKVTKKTLNKLTNFYRSYDYIKLSIASPLKIRKWAQRLGPSDELIGEIFRPLLFRSKSHSPEFYGLFCERIFGPINNLKCRCKSYKDISIFINKVCEECGIEITETRVRRYRMGYVQLMYPVAHHWYFDCQPSVLLDLIQVFFPRITQENMYDILYYNIENAEAPPITNYNKFILKYFCHEFPTFIDYRRKLRKEKKIEFNYIENYSFKIYFASCADKSSNKINLNRKNKENIYKAEDRKFIDFPIDSSQSKAFNNDLIEIEEREFYRFYKQLKILLSTNKSFNKPLSETIRHIFSKKICDVNEGAEFFQKLLDYMSPDIMLKFLKEQLTYASKKPKKEFNKSLGYKKILRQLKIFSSFFQTKTSANWIILTCIPVLPPSLRPILEINKENLAVGDLNELYQTLILYNNSLILSLLNIRSPEVQLCSWKSSLQKVMDSLINNARVPYKHRIKVDDRNLLGLTERLEGKFGRFRHNLLGKRTNFSGRSVITVNSRLRINQCGLPHILAFDLFKPILIKEIMTTFFDKKYFFNDNFEKATHIVENKFPLVWCVLGGIMSKSTVLLNRAPTLHKFGVQAFDPICIFTKGIQVHPLVCAGFNADFDGDQMAVHLPLYKMTQLEAKALMYPFVNIYLPSNGEVNLKPTQDIVIGCYYLTFMLNNTYSQFKYFFANKNKALHALSQKRITLHTPILLRYSSFCFFIFQKGSNFIFISNNEQIFSKKIKIFKIFKNYKEYLNIQIFTNLGIFFGKEKTTNIYEINEGFLETTVGRILFNNNFF